MPKTDILIDKKHSLKDISQSQSTQFHSFIQRRVIHSIHQLSD